MIPLDHLVTLLKAAGEPTRLRILLLLHRSELTVGEIQTVLHQSQPRVSRHLRLLVEAGLLTRHAEGTYVFYRWAANDLANQFLAALYPLASPLDLTVERDQARLSEVRATRAELAARSLSKVDEERAMVAPLTVPVPVVEKAIMDTVTVSPIEYLLDVGTGTGRMLELFYPFSQQALGVEPSTEMLNLARSRLDHAGLNQIQLRQGNTYDLELESGSVSLAIAHHLLHYLDEPSRAVDEMARVLTPGGQLIIVDYAPHDFELLRASYQHRRLGLAEKEVTGWCEIAGLEQITVHHLQPTRDATPADPDHHPQPITVTVWSAHKPHPSAT